jgi:DNA-binding LacI/PurR family transcriptional regulator
VLKVIEETGYRPHRLARTMREGRHGAIGLLVASPGAIPTRTLDFLTILSRRYDQMLMVEKLEAGHEPRLIAESCVDGLVLFESLDEAMEARVDQLPVPMVRVNTNRRSGRGVITFDEGGAVETAMRRFAERGGERPAFLAGSSPAHYSHAARLAALAPAAEEAGLADPIHLEAAPEKADRIVEQLLAAHPQVDSLLLGGEALVAPVYRAAMRQGRRIGVDLSVISFRHSASVAAAVPSLTTLEINPVHLARAVITRVVGLAGDDGAGPIAMPYELHTHESG